MTKLYHRISTFLSGCWAFITSISFATRLFRSPSLVSVAQRARLVGVCGVLFQH